MRAFVLWTVAVPLFIALACGQSNTDSDSGAGTEVSSPSSDNGDEIVVGGLYFVKNEDSSYAVLKVLVLDEIAVHLRSYANRFEEPPVNLDPSVLTLGGLDDPSGFGIGHFPLAREGFLADSPLLIMQVPVAEDELEGYRYYLEAMANR